MPDFTKVAESIMVRNGLTPEPNNVFETIAARTLEQERLIRPQPGDLLGPPSASEQFSIDTLLGTASQPTQPDITNAIDPTKVYRAPDNRIDFSEQLAREWGSLSEVAKKLPIAGSVIGGAEAFGIYTAARRLSDPNYVYTTVKKPDVSLDPDALESYNTQQTGLGESRERDIEAVMTYLSQYAEEQERGKTFGATVAGGLSQLPTWMIEFMLTGGLASIGKASTEKIALKILGNYAKTKAGQVALRAAGWAGGEITRATIGFAGQTAETAAKRQLESEVGIRPEESPVTSLFKAYGDTVIQTLSESAGDTISASGKWTVKQAAKFIPGGSKMIEALSRAGAGSVDNIVTRLAKKGGYSDFFGEMGEETLGKYLQAALDIEDFGAGEDASPLERLYAAFITDLKDKPSEAVVLAIPGIARSIAATSYHNYKTNKVARIQRDLMERYEKASAEVPNMEIEKPQVDVTIPEDVQKGVFVNPTERLERTPEEVSAVIKKQYEAAVEKELQKGNGIKEYLKGQFPELEDEYNPVGDGSLPVETPKQPPVEPVAVEERKSEVEPVKQASPPVVEQAAPPEAEPAEQPKGEALGDKPVPLSVDEAKAAAKAMGETIGQIASRPAAVVRNIMELIKKAPEAKADWTQLANDMQSSMDKLDEKTRKIAEGILGTAKFPIEESGKIQESIDSIRTALETMQTDPQSAEWLEQGVKNDPDAEFPVQVRVHGEVMQALEEDVIADGLPTHDSQGNKIDYTVAGETVTEFAGDVKRTAIRLFKGHAADTVAEEFMHAYFDKYLPDADKNVFSEWVKQNLPDDARPLREIWAQLGTTNLFSKMQRAERGAIRKMFTHATELLRKIFNSVRAIRKLNIPQQITEQWDKADAWFTRANEKLEVAKQDAAEIADVAGDIVKSHMMRPANIPLKGKPFKKFYDGLNEKAKATFDFFKGLNDMEVEIRKTDVEVWKQDKSHPAGWYKLKGDVSVLNRFLNTRELNKFIAHNKGVVELMKKIYNYLDEETRNFMGLKPDGLFEIKHPLDIANFDARRSVMQRIADARSVVLRENIETTEYTLPGTDITIDLGIKGKVPVDEHYRQALLAETRRQHKEGKLKSKNVPKIATDNFGTVGTLSTNLKTGANTDATTICPQMHWNGGCQYCYRRASLETGINVKLAAENITYVGDLLTLDTDKIKELNDVGGLRHQSFGDFFGEDVQTLRMFVDMLLDSETIDLSTKIITKEPSMIEYVARLKEQGLANKVFFNISTDSMWEKAGINTLTGMNAARPFAKINTKTGKRVDTGKKMKPNEAFIWKRALSKEEGEALVKKYPWVAMRTVALTTDEFIEDLKNPYISVVTGYHGDKRELERWIETEHGFKFLTIVEPVGDSGMPQFNADGSLHADFPYKRTHKWHKELAKRIQDEGLQEEYRRKSCCITGKCITCSGKCGTTQKVISHSMRQQQDTDENIEKTTKKYTAADQRPEAAVKETKARTARAQLHKLLLALKDTKADALKNPEKWRSLILRGRGLPAEVDQMFTNLEEMIREIGPRVAEEEFEKYKDVSKEDSVILMKHLSNESKYPLPKHLEKYKKQVRTDQAAYEAMRKELEIDKFPDTRIAELEKELEKATTIPAQQKIVDQIAELTGLTYVHQKWAPQGIVKKLINYRRVKRITDRPSKLLGRKFKDVATGIAAGRTPVHISESQAEWRQEMEKAKLMRDIIDFVNSSEELSINKKIAPEDWRTLDEKKFPKGKHRAYHPAIADALNELVWTPWHLRTEHEGARQLIKAVTTLNNTLKHLMFYQPFVMGKNDLSQAWRATGFGFMVKLPEAIKEFATKGARYQQFKKDGLYNNVVMLPEQADALVAEMMKKYTKSLGRRMAEHLGRMVTGAQILRDLHAANNYLTWNSDQILRTAVALWIQDHPGALKNLSVYERTLAANVAMAEYGRVKKGARAISNLFFFTPTYKISMLRAWWKMHKQPVTFRWWLARHYAYQVFVTTILPAIAVAAYRKWAETDEEKRIAEETGIPTFTAETERGYRVRVRRRGAKQDTVWSLSDPMLEQNKVLSRPIVDTLIYNLSALGQLLTVPVKQGFQEPDDPYAHFFKLGTPILRDIALWKSDNKDVAEKALTQLAVAYVFKSKPRPTKPDELNAATRLTKALGLSFSLKTQSQSFRKTILKEQLYPVIENLDDKATKKRLQSFYDLRARLNRLDNQRKLSAPERVNLTMYNQFAQIFTHYGNQLEVADQKERDEITKALQHYLGLAERFSVKE